MSVASILAMASTVFGIVYETKAVGAGAQLTKAWVARYSNLPGRLNNMTWSEKQLLFEREKILADFKLFIAYVSGVLDEDRVTFGTRTFIIKKISNWDEQGLYLKIALQEIK
jgi:head-tail adaptor